MIELHISVISQSLLTEISIVSTNSQLPTRHYTGFMLLISLFRRYIYGSFPSYIMRLSSVHYLVNLLLVMHECYSTVPALLRWLAWLHGGQYKYFTTKGRTNTIMECDAIYSLLQSLLLVYFRCSGGWINLPLTTIRLAS